MFIISLILHREKTFLYHEKIIYHNRIVTYGFVGFGTGMAVGLAGRDAARLLLGLVLRHTVDQPRESGRRVV